MISGESWAILSSRQKPGITTVRFNQTIQRREVGWYVLPSSHARLLISVSKTGGRRSPKLLSSSISVMLVQLSRISIDGGKSIAM